LIPGRAAAPDLCPAAPQSVPHQGVPKKMTETTLVAPQAEQAPARSSADREPGRNRRRPEGARPPAKRRRSETAPADTEEVLVPVAGIVDVLEKHAFVRTSGYLPGPDDIYVSLGQVRQYGLRRGDVVTGT